MLVGQKIYDRYYMIRHYYMDDIHIIYYTVRRRRAIVFVLLINKSHIKIMTHRHNANV